MPNVYTDAPEVRAVAAKLIPAHHPHLKDTRIEYVFRSQHSSNGGKVVMATARKVTGLNAFLANTNPEFELTNEEEENPEAFFCIEVWSGIWNVMDGAKKAALVDHELCHCGRVETETEDGTTRTAIVVLPHDLEEFTAVVERHGLWQEDVEKFIQAIRNVAPTLAVAPKAPAASQAELYRAAGFREITVDGEHYSCRIDDIGEGCELFITRQRDGHVTFRQIYLSQNLADQAIDEYAGQEHLPSLAVVNGDRSKAEKNASK
jgi:hypothetical protein